MENSHFSSSAQFQQRSNSVRGSKRRNSKFPAEAASIILNGVKNDEWRILVGPDAVAIDKAVREAPLNAYDANFGNDILNVRPAKSKL